ncbi:hypothetical protein AC1031_006166 [Aphanomyces cochlioides]|nr:hypothetical protein AC1031_006166 [Aphanomyces cochlioides]
MPMSNTPSQRMPSTRLYECNGTCFMLNPEVDSSFTKRYEKKHDFLSQKLVLKSIQQTLPPRDHVFPFRYQLPTGFSGSFDIDKANVIDARIEYFIKGMVSIIGPAQTALEKEQDHCLLPRSNHGFP